MSVLLQYSRGHSLNVGKFQKFQKFHNYNSLYTEPYLRYINQEKNRNLLKGTANLQIKFSRKFYPHPYNRLLFFITDPLELHREIPNPYKSITLNILLRSQIFSRASFTIHNKMQSTKFKNISLTALFSLKIVVKIGK